PYSVVLLDEVEKAHPDVLNLFYQIFDKGVANDGEGRAISFRNCVFLLTSNLASEHIAELCADGQRPDADALEQAIRPALTRHFKPALLARMQVVPYYPLSDELLRELIELRLARFGARLAARGVSFSHGPALVGHLATRCSQGERGARLIDQLPDRYLQPLVVDRLLDALADGPALRQLYFDCNDEGALCCECLCSLGAGGPAGRFPRAQCPAPPGPQPLPGQPAAGAGGQRRGAGRLRAQPAVPAR